MTKISIREAAFGGVGLIRRNPRMLAIWVLVMIAYAFVFELIMFALANHSQTQFDALRSWNPIFDILAADLTVPGRYLIPLVTIAFNGFVLAAVNRAVLRPEERRLGYFRLGLDEVRQMALLAAAYAVFVAINLALDLAVAGMGKPPPRSAGAWEHLIVFVLACLFLPRLTLLSAALFETGRLKLRDVWSMTKGQAGRIFATWLVAGVGALVVGLAWTALSDVIVSLLNGASPNIMADDRFDAMAVFMKAPGLEWLVISSPADVLVWLIGVPPLALMYRQLSRPADSVSTPAPATAAPLQIPVHIEKTFAMPLWMVAVCLAVIGIKTILPMLASPPPPEAMLSDSNMIALLGTTALLAAVYFVMRWRTSLDIEPAGVTLVLGKTRRFVAWAEVAQVKPLKKSIRIELKGRPENEGLVIPERYGPTSAQLTATIEEGARRWGGGRVTEAAAAGFADARRSYAREFIRRLWAIQLLLAVGILAAIVIWQLGDYEKAMRLRGHGVRTQATVERIYQSDCGRNSCRLNVRYSYPSKDGKKLVGHAYLTRDDELDDPDYVYAKSHPTIPIVVDPTDWKTSDVNFNDRVFTGDPLRAMLLMIGITAVALIVGFGMMYGIIFLSYRKLLRPAEGKVF